MTTYEQWLEITDKIKSLSVDYSQWNYDNYPN